MKYAGKAKYVGGRGTHVLSVIVFKLKCYFIQFGFELYVNDLLKIKFYIVTKHDRIVVTLLQICVHR